MGSTICISLYHERAEILLDEAVQLLHVYKNRFSANDEDSELMTINHLAGIKSVSVHPELFELIELGKYHSLAEGSHLNITIWPSSPDLEDRIFRRSSSKYGSDSASSELN